VSLSTFLQSYKKDIRKKEQFLVNVMLKTAGVDSTVQDAMQKCDKGPVEWIPLPSINSGNGVSADTPPIQSPSEVPRNTSRGFRTGGSFKTG
jgi:hypothetical protein